MVAHYSTLLQIILVLFCIGSMMVLFSPLLNIASFLFFRATTAFAAFARIPAPGGVQFFLPPLLILLLQTIVALIYSPVRFRVNRVFGMYLLFMLLITVIAAIFAANGADPARGIEEITKCTFPILAYVLVYVGISQESDLAKISRYIAIGSLGAVFPSIIEAIMGQGYDYMSDGFSPNYPRPAGTIVDANLFGIYVSLCLFLALPQYLIQKKTLSRLYILLLLISNILSENRGTWIALTIAFMLSVPLFKRYLRLRNWVISAIIILMLAAPILITRFSQLNEYDQYGQKLDTATGRLEYSTSIFEMALESPLFGNGPYSYEKVGIDVGHGEILPPHDDYVRVACEYGFPAMLLYIYFFLSQFIWAVKHRGDRLWQYQFASCAGQIYLIIISVAQNILTDTVSYMLIFSLMAISHRASAFSKLKPQDEEKLSPSLWRHATENSHSQQISLS